MKVAGRWRYVYRAIDQFGQVIDVVVSACRDAKAAHWCFLQALGTTRAGPSEVVSDRVPTYLMVLEELLPAAWHRIERYANDHIEADHRRLKSRLRPMRGLKRARGARVLIVRRGLVQQLRRGHDEVAVEEPTNRRLAVAFDELAEAICYRAGWWPRPAAGWQNTTQPCPVPNARMGSSPTQRQADAPAGGSGRRATT